MYFFICLPSAPHFGVLRNPVDSSSVACIYLSYIGKLCSWLELESSVCGKSMINVKIRSVQQESRFVRAGLLMWCKINCVGFTSLDSTVCDDKGITSDRSWSNGSHLGVMRAWRWKVWRHVFLFTHTAKHSQELLLTLSQVTTCDISQQTVKNTWPISTQMANSASRCCTSFTSRGASKFIQTNHKVINTCTIFILFFNYLCFDFI